MKIMNIKDFRVLFLIFLILPNVFSSDNRLVQSPHNGPAAGVMQGQSSTIYSSFIQLSENLEAKTGETSQLSNMMSEMMMTQQVVRKKKRYTVDGRLCSPVFVQDGIYHHDCTELKSPDGLDKKKEWCYVDQPGKGDKTWGYCRPIMDYDKIREDNQQQMKEFAIRARKAQGEIESQLGPNQQALDNLKKVREGQAELDSKINEMLGEMGTLANNMQNLFNTKDQWEKEEEKAVSIGDAISKRTDKKKEEEASIAAAAFDKSEDTMKKEFASTNVQVNPFIQQRVSNPSFECGGTLMYEEDPKGDGIMGYYYDNESFLGEYIEQKDFNIEFEWTGASPTGGINSTNYSVRWEGFILASITTNYQFSIECDDGATVAINNRIIVSHNMYIAGEETKNRVDKWLSKEVEKKNNPTKNFNKSTSAPIKLIGGSKYKIIVSYYHSVHNDIKNDEKAFVRLYWQSDEFCEKIVAKQYFYSQNSYSPLKISALSSEVGVVRKLHMNDSAFKNSDKYVLRDIPPDFQGLACLKLNMKYLEKELKFDVNVPIIVYIGRLAHYPRTVPDDFENTGEYMSLLQVKPPSPNKPDMVISPRSALVKIYKKKFDAGSVLIPLSQKGINIKGMPLIVFYGYDSQIGGPTSCGGEEWWISDPNSPHFKECSESSYWEANWRCRNGLNGKNKDTEGSTWATKREGIGGWIQVDFRQLYQVTKITVQNRKNPAERNSIVVANFSGGEIFEMKLKNLDEEQEFKLPNPFKATWVKIVIKEIFGTINNGGSYKLYGLKCLDTDDLEKKGTPEAMNGILAVAGINPKALPPLFKVEDRKPSLLFCKESISNSKKLDHVKMTPGNKILIKCYENCATSPYSIYGDIRYTKDSSICKAAYHAEKLKAEGGLVTLVFGLGEYGYRGVIRNGIRSKNKFKSDITISFEPVNSGSDAVIAAGAKLDVRSEGKWLPCVINKIIDIPVGKVLQMTIEGTESVKKPIEMFYPNAEKILPCGEKVKDRECKGSRSKPKNTKPVKIKFVPPTYNKPGDFLADKGELYGKNGHPYGWTKDMSGRIKTREGGSKPEMDTLVEFPPSPKSKFCNRPSPEVLCDKVTWSVKTGHGKFNVKIYIGDPQGNTRIDLKINDMYVVKGKTIPKNQLKVYEGAYDAINEHLTISSDCEQDCEYAMSKMNMIEMFPVQAEARREEEPTPEKKDPCGNAQKGGRCDKGPDVTHCIFEDANAEAAKFCGGNNLMVQIPKSYRCASQRDKFKCVKRQYKNQGECAMFCPGTCTKGMCL